MLQYLHSYFPDTIKLWNTLPYNIVSCKSVGAFKHALYAILSIMYINISLVCTFCLVFFSAWLHIHLASSYLCTQLYPFHIQQNFHRKKTKTKKSAAEIILPRCTAVSSFKVCTFRLQIYKAFLFRRYDILASFSDLPNCQVKYTWIRTDFVVVPRRPPSFCSKLSPCKCALAPYLAISPPTFRPLYSVL